MKLKLRARAWSKEFSRHPNEWKLGGKHTKMKMNIVSKVYNEASFTDPLQLKFVGERGGKGS